jgi:hypothetical protein
VALPSAPAIANGTPIPQDGPAALTLRYVERLPALDYVPNAADPAVEGWPAPGSPVTWRAHLKNWSGGVLAGVDYAWTLDGQRVAEGRVDVGAGAEATVDFPWTWERARHELVFTVDAGNRHTIPGSARNSVLLHTDALSLAFYVERSFYDFFRAHQHELRVGHSSFEDWAQFQVRCYNQILANAVFPDTPRGALDRIRLDRVHVVADGALPLDRAAFSIGGTFDARQGRPNLGDRSVDLQWGFPSSLITAGGQYTNRTSPDTSNQFYYSGYVQHELGHARYLIDVYGFDVYDGTSGSRVDITEGGVRVAGTPLMPGRAVVHNGVAGTQVHRARHQGLMTAEWRYLDRYSAAALNLIAGHRATAGNYVVPDNIGAFLDDLPRRNRLTLRDAGGGLLPGASVRVFQAEPGDAAGGLYSKRSDDRPDLELAADGEGQVDLGANPFTPGAIVHDDPFANGVVILRIEHEGRVAFAFLEVSDFHLEYWRGHAEQGRYEMSVAFP